MTESRDALLGKLDRQLVLLERDVALAREILSRMRPGFASASDLPRPSADRPDLITNQVKDVLPVDLLPKLTVALQDYGAVTITCDWLKRSDWVRIHQKVLQMGGKWVSKGKTSHWSIPVPKT